MKLHPAWKLLGKIALVLVPFIALSLIVIIRTPYITYMQESLIQDKIQKLVMDASSSPQVIIAGDSRAEQNVIPAIFTKESGLNAVNVGVGDEVLDQAYELLNKEGALNHGRLIIVSVSIYDINDTAGHDQLIDKSIINAEPLSKQKVKDILSYYKAVFDYYLNYIKDTMRFAKFDNAHMSPALFATKGYLGSNFILTLPTKGEPAPFDPLGWYTDLRLGGLRQQNFIKSIQYFGATNDTVVIYIGPVAPLGKEVNKGTKADIADTQFAQVITNAIAPYPNIHFINFEATDTSNILPNQAFGDYVHLNEKGATLFTTLLYNTLVQEKIIK